MIIFLTDNIENQTKKCFALRNFDFSEFYEVFQFLFVQ